MGYTVIQRIISDADDLYGYLDNNARKAKRLYNASLFRMRNVFTGYDKEHRTANEQQVFDEVEQLHRIYPNINIRRVLSYKALEKMMRVTENPDFQSGLPSHTAQHVVMQAVTDFKNWLKACRKYKKNPKLFTGKPRMPGYKQNDVCTYEFSNQMSVLRHDEKGIYLTLPLKKNILYFSNLSEDALLKNVVIKPYYGRYLMCLTIEEPDSVITGEAGTNVCAIDFGVKNFAAIVCNDGTSALYKGEAILSDRQWFHKQKARYTTIITKGHEHIHIWSRKLNNLSYHSANFVKDQCHKISSSIVSYCIEHNAGTLVLGINKYWKQNSNMGKTENQNFVSMPITILRKMITYKAIKVGIKVIEQEESYTSKADVTSMDYIPTYGVDDEKTDFSGTRVKRGLYRCGNGTIINADCNGAANIMRKALPDVWKSTENFDFLATPKVYGFHEMNPKRISVRGIVA